jgi:hypothetical protein
VAIFTEKVWDGKTCQSCAFFENYYYPTCKYATSKAINCSIKKACPPWCPRRKDRKEIANMVNFQRMFQKGLDGQPELKSEFRRKVT